MSHQASADSPALTELQGLLHNCENLSKCARDARVSVRHLYRIRDGANTSVKLADRVKLAALMQQKKQPRRKVE